MASNKLKKKSSTFLSLEQTRTIKPADFKNHQKLRDLSHDDLIELLCLMEAELQAKDVLLKAVLCGEAGVALPLSHLLNDAEGGTVVEEEEKHMNGFIEDEDEIWMGEPSAHLNHVSAYHQVVKEQMNSIVQTLRTDHKKVVDQLDDERHKHAVDTAQGDDVTYMLEKERERLQQKIDCEQAKYTKLEKERDQLLKVIETERRDQYNTFQSLLTDCKAFALQLVEQNIKLEKHQKDVDKEKQKNKVLSELMVNETQKFKEKLKLYEDEVNDFYVLEQKKADLEMKLTDSERQIKEFFHLLNEERKQNAYLRFQLNKLKKELPDSYDLKDGGEEDLFLVQDQLEIGFREARINSDLQSSNNNDYDSQEPQSIHHAAVMQPAKFATVQKSSTIKQNNKVYLPQTKTGMVVTVNSMINSPQQYNSYDSQKRHSFEERKFTQDYNFSDPTNKRNSFESINHASMENNQNSQIRTKNLITKHKHSSYEEVRNIGSPSVNPKRNSFEGDSKRTPPPAPPRRGSVLTTASSTDKPPIVKIPQQLQPRKSAMNNMSYTPSRPGASPDTFPLMVFVCCSYGLIYTEDNKLQEVEELHDFLSFIIVKPSCTWYELTCIINETFEKECSVLLSEDEGVTSDSIHLYQYGDITWTMQRYPDVSLYKILAQHDAHVIVTLKGVQEYCLHDLSYSSMMSIQALEECVRIVKHDKRLLLPVNTEVEGEHFVSCLSKWIEMNECQSSSSCTMIKVDANNNHNITDLTTELESYGLFQNINDQRQLDSTFVLAVNLDFVESKGFTSIVFDWLSSRLQPHNYYSIDTDSTFLHKDILVVAYVTNDRITHLTQNAYRLFKIMSLPSLLPDLVYRWLTQKINHYPADVAMELNMLGTVNWLSHVYQSLQKSFFKIELAHKLPEISVYMNAPLDHHSDLYSWIKLLWTNQITPCVEDSVRQRTGAALGSQQETLIKATLKALFEKSIRPGCPIELNL